MTRSQYTRDNNNGTDTYNSMTSRRGRSRRRQNVWFSRAKKTATLCLCSALVFGSSASVSSSSSLESGEVSANADFDSSEFLSQAGISSDYSDASTLSMQKSPPPRSREWDMRFRSPPSGRRSRI